MPTLTKPTTTAQGGLIQAGLDGLLDDGLDENEKVYAMTFRRLYFYLYANSSSSRAERILSDLSNLLLFKIVAERNGGRENMEAFLDGIGSANELLLPILWKAFPHLMGEGERFHLDDKTLRYGIKELASLSLDSASAHVMGEAFQALIGPRLRGDKGQFFTPRGLVRAIIQILCPPLNAKVVDPAAGTGGFLTETHIFQISKRDSASKMPLGKLIAMEKDRDLCRLAEATLEIAAPGRGIILNLNSLDLEGLCSLPADQSPLSADFVLTNPPFGAHIKITEREILKQYALGHTWRWTDSVWLQQTQLRDAQDPQILFVELSIRLLKPGGKLGIVLPEGVFGNQNMGYVWDYIRSQGKIVALLDCPRTTFQPSTDTKTNVLFFEKSDDFTVDRAGSTEVWTAVALHCGHDRRGRSRKQNGDVYPDDFSAIGATYSAKGSTQSAWQEVTITDPYYLCPRYYDKTPLDELKQEAERLGASLVSIREMIKNGYLRIRKGNEVGAESYGTGEIPFVRTSDISNYEVSIDPTKSVSEEVFEKYRQYQQLASNDILIVCDGRYRIGRTAMLHEHTYRCVVQSHLQIVTVADHSPIHAIELLYLLNLPMIQHQLRNLVFIQSTLGSLGRRLHEVLIPLPKRTNEWERTINEFGGLIYGRAEQLRRLQKFEHQGYEL